MLDTKTAECYTFWTPEEIPLDAFTTFGVNSKPNSTNPIGYFGTGLKYAVAIILRHGGTIKLTIGTTEYEFYISDKDFRGKPIQKVRMRKRTGLLKEWRSAALPFTTELGKNWKLWQAYRELESNTRDEKGQGYGGDPLPMHEGTGTLLQVYCDGFGDAGEEVFLDMRDAEPVVSNRYMDIYDYPSSHLYYRGVRVQDLRYPARLTYNFKQGIVELSEDRSARNAYMLYYYASQTLRREINDRDLLLKVLRQDPKASHFEGFDLQYDHTDYDVSEAFKSVARELQMKGFAAPQVASYYSSYSDFRSPARKFGVQLTAEEWETVEAALEAFNEHELVDKIKGQLE